MSVILKDTDRIRVAIYNDALFVKVPLSLIVFAQEERPDFPLKIHSKEDMSKWIKKHILDFGGNSEDGATKFEKFLDELFIYAYENGERWIDSINID